MNSCLLHIFSHCPLFAQYLADNCRRRGRGGCEAVYGRGRVSVTRPQAASSPHPPPLAAITLALTISGGKLNMNRIWRSRKNDCNTFRISPSQLTVSFPLNHFHKMPPLLLECVKWPIDLIPLRVNKRTERCATQIFNQQAGSSKKQEVLSLKISSNFYGFLDFHASFSQGYVSIAHCSTTNKI